MLFRARTPESACRHTGAPWGRRDIYLPPCWTRSVQAYLPSDDHVAARSLFRQCRLKLAPRDRMKSWGFLPRDMTNEEREVSPGAQAQVRPTTDSFLGAAVKVSLLINWLRCLLFSSPAFSIHFASWQKSSAMHKPPLPALKIQRNTDRPFRHIFNNCRNPKEPQHQVLRS